MNLVAHLYRQMGFSLETFGPGERSEAVIDHIRSELEEIAENPTDVTEWIDVAMLAFDGAWRAGYSPETIAEHLRLKLNENMRRKWPNWWEQDPDRKIEHVKDGEE